MDLREIFAPGDAGAALGAGLELQLVQESLRGAKAGPVLLFAKAGKGTYVYTSLTWFRQLRNMNPGAMKMIANVISYAWR